MVLFCRTKTDIEQIVYEEIKGHFKEGKDFCFNFAPKCKYNYRPDFYFPDARLIVECDGKIWHQKEHDRKRDHYFKNRGMLTLRFTDDEIKNDPKKVIGKIMEVYHERKKNHRSD